MENAEAAPEKGRKKSSSTLTSVLLVFILLLGVGIIAYPTVSDYWNSRHQSRAIATYADTVSKLAEEDYTRIWEDAWDYNQSLTMRSNVFLLSEEQQAEYERLLDIDGTGIMGSIEIPKIRVSLPVYHGVRESVLQVAIGHIEWTSLPVGGEGSHCVLSGHRGLPSSRLFTDLDQMEVGDIFTLHILNEVLTYEVDQIKIVLPQEMGDLLIEPGKDLCTLVTCTPYSINTHRLLVRGRRIDNLDEDAPAVIHVTAEAVQIPGYLVVPAVGIPLLLIFHIFMLAFYSRRKKDYSAEELERTALEIGGNVSEQEVGNGDRSKQTNKHRTESDKE